MGLFGQTKPKDPRETIREMKRKMRSEQRGIDRNINHIKREELKVKVAALLCCIETKFFHNYGISIVLKYHVFYA